MHNCAVHYDEALRYAEGSECTVGALAAHAREVRSKLFVELLAHGNLTPEQVLHCAYPMLCISYVPARVKSMTRV